MASKRLLPVGTSIVLKKPLTERDIPTIESQSFTMGRISDCELTDGRYGVQFEGLSTEEGNHPLTFYFGRDEFVLARTGT